MQISAAGPGRRQISERRGQQGRLIVSTGRAQAGPADDPVEVGPGDYLTYPGDVTHVFRALGPDTTGVLVMEHI